MYPEEGFASAFDLDQVVSILYLFLSINKEALVPDIRCHIMNDSMNVYI